MRHTHTNLTDIYCQILNTNTCFRKMTAVTQLIFPSNQKIRGWGMVISDISNYTILSTFLLKNLNTRWNYFKKLNNIYLYYL